MSFGKIIKIKYRRLEVKWPFDGCFIYENKDKVPRKRWQTTTNVFSPFAVVRRRSQWFAVVHLILKTPIFD